MKRPVDVRVLTPDDVATLRAVLDVFAGAFEDAPTYLARQPDDGYLADLLARDTFVAVAASVDGKTVGGLTGYVLPKCEQARAELYLYDLGVDAGYRRQGVATAMIERLAEHAAERSVSVIFVQADPVDEPAVALYDKLGTRADVLHFDIVPRPRRP